MYEIRKTVSSLAHGSWLLSLSMKQYFYFQCSWKSSLIYKWSYRCKRLKWHPENRKNLLHIFLANGIFQNSWWFIFSVSVYPNNIKYWIFRSVKRNRLLSLTLEKRWKIFTKHFSLFIVAFSSLWPFLMQMTKWFDCLALALWDITKYFPELWRGKISSSYASKGGRMHAIHSPRTSVNTWCVSWNIFVHIYHSTDSDFMGCYISLDKFY